LGLSDRFGIADFARICFDSRVRVTLHFARGNSILVHDYPISEDHGPFERLGSVKSVVGGHDELD